MVQGEQHFDDGDEAEGGGEVEIGVREAGGRGVGVVQEVRVRVQDAGYEEGVGGVDCAADAEGGVDPERRWKLAFSFCLGHELVCPHRDSMSSTQ